MYLITVIVCTYNSQNTINRALVSVFSQIGLNVEFEFQVIVVDDCSQDNTLEVLKQFPVEVYKNEKNSGGPNKGRNLALRNAKGDYIAFIDHDDEWLPDKIKSQIDVISGEKVVTSGYLDLDVNTHKKRTIQNQSDVGMLRYAENVTFLAKLTRAKQSQKTYFGSIMIHKDLRHVLFEEEFGMVDFDWVLRIFKNQASVEITKPLFVRYVNGSNLSLNERYRLNDFVVSSKTIDSYRKQYPKQCKKGLKRLSGSMARYYYLVGKGSEARKYLLKANFSLVNVLYFLTSFWGREYVVKRFKVFG
jgi:glycosyltransferase involved in cell wall biosynthesis